MSFASKTIFSSENPRFGPRTVYFFLENRISGFETVLLADGERDGTREPAPCCFLSRDVKRTLSGKSLLSSEVLSPIPSFHSIPALI